MARDKDDRVRERKTVASSTKGAWSNQAYNGASGRVVTGTGTGKGDDKTDGTNASVTNDTTTSTQSEDKGLVLKFRIPIQSKNPVSRV